MPDETEHEDIEISSLFKETDRLIPIKYTNYALTTLPRIKICIQSKERTILLDSGAACNLIRANQLTQKLVQQKVEFSLACGENTIKSKGCVELEMDIGKFKTTATFYVLAELNKDYFRRTFFTPGECHTRLSDKMRILRDKDTRNQILECQRGRTTT